MLNDYIKAALKRAEYKKLDDESWFAEIRDDEIRQIERLWETHEIIRVPKFRSSFPSVDDEYKM